MLFLARHSLLTVCVLAAGVKHASAFGQNYTKCKATSSVLTDTSPYCLPTGAADAVTLSIAYQGSDTNLVAVVPARNCRTATGKIYGGVSLAIDSSGSLTTTDPENQRLDVAKTFIDSTYLKANSQNNLPAGNDFPRLGTISYVGRSGFVDGKYEADGLNEIVTPEYCSDGDNIEGKYPTDASKIRYDGGTDATKPLSFCEFLRPTLANVLGNNISVTPIVPGMDRHSGFFQASGKSPRGATDLTYFFEAIKRNEMLGGLTTNAKNAIVISDGLPNIPKKVPIETCRTTAYLQEKDKDGKTSIKSYKDEKGQEFCYDRNFRAARTSADNYLENNANFQSINVYHALFVADEKAFYDEDAQGTMNPADFLIESSARSGNGKVKFKYSKSKAELSSWLDTLFVNFDEVALQRVSIKVNNNPIYNAVSPGGTRKDFSLKFVGLNTGANTVVVTSYYSDATTVRTYTVNVAAAGGTVQSDYQCETTDGTGRTVDGDLITSKTPAGDGVKPITKADKSQDRVYRNNDPANDLTDKDFTRGVANSEPAKSGEPDPSTLRLQGGTGNCGSIAAFAQNSTRGFLESVLMILILAAPAALVLGIRKKGRNV